MAVFKNGIFATYNGQIVTPQSLGISLAGIQTCHQFFSSGSLTDTTQRYAVYALVADLENYGLWDKMKVIYPMVGQAGVSSSFQLNLKDPSTFKGTFTAGWTFASTGATPNGTAYMDTGLNMASELSQDNVHCSVYSRTDITQNRASIGALNTDSNGGLYIYPKFNSTRAYFSAFNATGGNSDALVSSSLGFFVVSRIISTSEQFFQNTTKTSNTNNSTTPISQNIYIGAVNLNGTVAAFDIRENAFSSIGDGLTDDEAANFYTAVQRFQTTLGRQV